MLIPERGVSALDAPGQPFVDPEADAALFEELESAVEPGPGRTIRRLPFHINDAPFAQALVESFLELDDSRGPAMAIDTAFGGHPTERPGHA
jgi:uncharacterized protein (UPF0261 family)